MDEDLIKRLYELYCICMDKEILDRWDLNRFMNFFKTRSNDVIIRTFRNVLNEYINYINTNKFNYIDMINELEQLINTDEYSNLIIAFELIYERFSFK